MSDFYGLRGILESSCYKNITPEDIHSEVSFGKKLRQ